MDKLVIEGGYPLKGEITISGAKNAALPILMASLMVEKGCTFFNVPQLRDIRTTLNLLEHLGCEVEKKEKSIRITPHALKPEAPYDLVRTMRASILCLGPLLAVLGEAKVALPGGCAIGARPVDLHLKGLEKMGASFTLEEGYILGRCKKLQGAHIYFDFPTVGGTENLLMAAVLAEGETILENAAREPEVVDLANFLIHCGADIKGHGTSIIKVRGVKNLKAKEYKIMSDRIEAGTYMVAAAITQGELILNQCPIHSLDAVMSKLTDMGVGFEILDQDKVKVKPFQEIKSVDVITAPYPGFPTDMQAQIMALMCLAQGAGTIKETIFENRFMHVLELVRLGADIRLSKDTAFIRGVKALKGAPVMASDLRASASLVLAGLAAKGKTEVRRVYHLDRGYENMEVKLNQVGAKIKRIKE
ncbi:MAG: UDP-N-acetylglucosamine 1-carboxyvinyltransferase [Desulfonauticus sp.]|jgi:UDP-N-acetylglucosamine 1-carboxyvinyltransferase|nr:UDP-N-acetylglucosamine 1-carboxyvinyltransferase [Desulfonauticus sp.]